LPTLPKSIYPRVVIVTEKMLPRTEREKEARKAFLWLLRKETTIDLSEKISAIDIVALVPKGKMSVEACYRYFKECLLNISDQVQKNREETRTLFSAIHFAVFFRYTCVYFSESSQEPFDFVTMSRKQNPVVPDLGEYLSNFIKYIKSPNKLTKFAVPIIASSFLLDNYPPDNYCKCCYLLQALDNLIYKLVFEPENVFRVLYRDVLYQVSNRVIVFEGSQDIILQSSFTRLVESNLRGFFEQLVYRMLSLEIYRRNLGSFESR
jgi:hypothetical protein